MKVFSKKKFFEADVGNCADYCRFETVRKWVDESDGKPIIRNCCNGRYVWDFWTEKVDNTVEESAKILNEVLPKGFPKGTTWGETVNCRCSTKPNPCPDYQIIINCYDDTTHAEMFVNGIRVKETKAKRNPADKFNWRIGAQTAFNRLWEKKKPKPAVREVKRYAKPWEWVKVVAANNDSSNEYKNGDVLQIIGGGTYSSLDTRTAYYKEEAGKFLNVDEYVVLEGYKPE